jgi:uncharacterized protein DUF4199
VKVGVKWGIILGVTVCVWTLLLHVLGLYTTRLQLGQYADIVATVIPIVILFLAIRERRARNPGQTLTIGEGLATGVVTGLVSVPITAGFLWIYHHYINPRWMDLLIAWKEEQLRAQAKAPETISATIEAMRASATDTAQLTGALIGTLVLSLALSLVIAAILRRRNPVNAIGGNRGARTS